MMRLRSRNNSELYLIRWDHQLKLMHTTIATTRLSKEGMRAKREPASTSITARLATVPTDLGMSESSRD